MVTKPNIILFITHDQGQLVGCYDSPQIPNSLNTPNLNRLAEEGVRFTNYFCTAPQCSPSRGSIQTSLYPHQNGLMGLANPGPKYIYNWTLPKTNKTLPMYLKENGYTAHLIGLQHESKRFRDIKSTLGYETKNKIDKIPKFLLKYKDDENPFYACIGTFEVHIPFEPFGVPDDPKNVKIPPFLPDHVEVRKDFAEFYGSIHSVDKMIGKIINCLEVYGMKNNTLFIFTTDHGIPFPRAKCTLYDPGIKTALIMSLPNSNLFSGGKVIESMMSNIDLLPTILDFIGGDIPKNITGKSFLSVLKNENKIFRKEIFVEKTWHDTYDPMRGIRTENYKYIRNFEKCETAFEVPADMVYQLRTGKLVDKIMKEIYEKPRLDEELYDLRKDPNEITNVINEPAYDNVAKELRKKLYDWMEMTNDPILKGKIMPPKKI
ncbi:MAG: sulfatase [Candidatus Helarchaeota archaeon]|nr:sulfatase [Candidatus Helarchaeota archaeon]